MTTLDGTRARHRVVATDTCILINLYHVDRLSILGQLAGYEFVIPEQVVTEVSRPEQREALEHALRQGWLREVPMTDLDAMRLYTSFRESLGSGEAACLAMAAHNGWMIASDERRLFRRLAVARLGEARLLTTVQLYVFAIHGGLLSIDEADQDKVVLESHRFHTGLSSFAEIIETHGQQPTTPRSPPR